MQSIWKFFASVKLTVVLLISLAATSIIGTVIPQNEDPKAYFQAYGDVLYRLFGVLDFFDMYHSWWFQLLLIWLTANIVVCSIDRLKSTGKIIIVKKPLFQVERFRKIKDARRFSVEEAPAGLLKRYLPFVSRRYGYHLAETTDNGFVIFAERFRWTRLGVYVVHLSVVLLLLGGLIGSQFGFDGYVNIAEGESVGSIGLRSGQGKQDLGFKVRCDDFDVTFYDSGAPREFRSRLSIIENGRVTVQKDIIVNHPLRYKGINFFQSSYGSVAPKNVDLSYTSVATGMSYRKTVTIGRQFDLSENLGKLVVVDFNSEAKFRGHPIGAAFVARFIPARGAPQDILLPLKFPSFDKMRKGRFVMGVSGYEERYYTGLQVTKDPGVVLVYIGFVAIIIGCFITFFMSHQRLCIEAVGRGAQTAVSVAVTVNKNKLSVPGKIERLADRLKRLS